MERFHAVFEHVDGWWIGYTEELPGANAQARTLDEARDDLREASRLILEVNRELARDESGLRHVIAIRIGARCFPIAAGVFPFLPC